MADLKPTDADLDLWLQADDGRLYNLTIASELRRKKLIYGWCVEHYEEPNNEDKEPELVSWGRKKTWAEAFKTVFEQAATFERGVALRKLRLAEHPEVLRSIMKMAAPKTRAKR